MSIIASIDDVFIPVVTTKFYILDSEIDTTELPFQNNKYFQRLIYTLVYYELFRMVLIGVFEHPVQPLSCQTVNLYTSRILFKENLELHFFTGALC